ncbi:MAG: LamG domain-containing protein, partial [Candidatus Poribacteria bacterium]|nr:LamG domain-containing protein [Candidatus Poribacteria bacterium]
MWKQVQIVLVLLFLFSTLMFCLVAQASLDDKSLVLYLSFDEGKGDIAKDSSKHGHDGTLINNPKWVGGKFGKALEFDGNKETHVKVPITDALQLREKFSAAFWVKRGKQIRDWNYMIGGGSLKWHVIFQNATKKTYLWTRSGGAWAQKAISDDIQPEGWVHITVTHDTASKVVMYYNGKKSGEGPK